MIKLILSIILVLFASAFLLAQDDEFYDAVVYLEGVNSIEELDEDIISDYYRYYRNKLRLNTCSENALKKSGLFTTYRIAALKDYMDRNGLIYSFNELIIVDGYNACYVEALKPFISLNFNEDYDESPYVDNGVFLGLKYNKDYSYRFKYNLDYKNRFGLNLGMKTTYDKAKEPYYSASLVYSGKEWLNNLIVGDYYLNLGQGLILWTGFSLSGLSSSMIKTKYGISPYRSYYNENAHRGVAVDVDLKKFHFGTSFSVLALDELMCGVKDEKLGLMMCAFSRYNYRNGHLGFQLYLSELSLGEKSINEKPLDGKLSFDARWAYRGVELFGELAYDFISSVPAGIIGARYDFSTLSFRVYPANYVSKYAAALRSSTKTSNEYALAWTNNFTFGPWVELRGKTGIGSSVIKNRINTSLDLALFPEPKSSDKEDGKNNSKYLKFIFNYYSQLSEIVEFRLKLSERCRTYNPYNRSEIQSKLIFTNNVWNLNSQINAVYSDDLAILFYLEGGYKFKGFSSYLRSGIFKADDWDDRIYVYERDAPGSFNVPAYYGRGLWFALVFSYRFTDIIKLYLRSSYKTYSLMEERKPSKLELSFFISWEF